MNRDQDSGCDDRARLLDEIEQLRTALESSIEENAQLIDDRERLRIRVAVLARELQLATTGAAPPAKEPILMEILEAKQDQAEEELRVAFEELQVLAEELEAANTGLQQANDQLEARVEARTRAIAATSADLRRSEQRFRTLIEGMPQLVWRAVGGEEWTWSSPQWSAFTGQSQAQSLGPGWLEAFHPDDRETARAAWERAYIDGHLAFEARLRFAPQDRYRHFQTRAMPVRAPDGRIIEWIGTSTDVDDILRLQARQAVLMGELQHRTRNLMAVIQSVTRRTIKDSGSLDDFRAQIEKRMEALARVQGLLSRRDAGAKVSFDALLRQELSAHVPLGPDDTGPQVALAGPAGIPLQSSLVQTFALALHELATNAVKYGALSTPDGFLEVTWREIAREAAPSRLLVEWRERGVVDMPDAAAPPRGGGYGRELIERALPYQMGAKTAYHFTPDGIHCTIEVDIPKQEEIRS